MSVVHFNGNLQSCTIGLIACSNHQAAKLPLGITDYRSGAQHKPKLDFINAPGPGQQRLNAYLEETIGVNARRDQRPEKGLLDDPQYMGHTALFARASGEASWAEGW